MMIGEAINIQMQCPNCSTQMQLMERYDVDYCPSCWIRRNRKHSQIAIDNEMIIYHFMR
jgi:Zn finger protein HypA/HybF involved in hydrogenase expression